MIEAQNGALREMRETISSIADVFKEDRITIPFGEMWEFDLNVDYSWRCCDTTQAKVNFIELTEGYLEDIKKVFEELDCHTR